jgi:phage-related protein
MYGELKNTGKYLVEGLWNGLLNKADWLYNKVKSFANNIVGNIKKALGIKSPSRVFRDEVGTNMALGLGEGFSDTMSDVTKEMQSAIPTEFDTNVNMKSSTGASGSNYDMMISAFEKALTNVKVVMNDREFGTFVSDTMEGLVYS